MFSAEKFLLEWIASLIFVAHEKSRLHVIAVYGSQLEYGKNAQSEKYYLLESKAGKTGLFFHFRLEPQLTILQDMKKTELFIHPDGKTLEIALIIDCFKITISMNAIY